MAEDNGTYNDGGGNWFQQNAPAATNRDWPSSPALDQIAEAFRAQGIEPTRDLVMQWGSNIDQRYLSQILSSIAQLPMSPRAATPAPTTTPTSTSSTGGGLTGDAAKAAFGQAWIASGGRTVSDLKAFADKWNAEHPDAKVTLGGSKGDKVYGPGGSFWADAVIGAGDGGGRGASWQTEAGGDSKPGNLLDPFPGQFSYQNFTPPPDFVAPTADQAFNDQGFQFALKQGQEALERSAAAKGTLLTTGTLKNLSQFNQDAASQQYDKVYNRRLGEYENAYGHAQTNYERDYNQALGQFGLRHDLWNEAQDRPFNKLYSLAQLGQVGGGNAQNYANGGSQTLTGIGNANAAATMYGGNATQNAFGNLANLAGFYAQPYLYRANGASLPGQLSRP